MTDSDVNVLIVEDDALAAEAAGKLIRRKLGAQVRTANDRGAARKALSDGRADVVILDYELPDGTGLDLLEEITSTDDPPSVVMVTGQGDESVAAEALRLRASGYVVKDENLVARLPEAVRTAISEVELRRAREALARANDELERKVRERTEELARANEELQAEVAERKRAEETLKLITEQIQRQAETLDQILSTSPDQFYLLDERGKFIYASRPAAEVLGMTQEQMSGKYWWDLGMPAGVMECVDLQRERVKNSGDQVTYEVKFPTVNGVRDLQYVLTPIPREDGRVTTVVATVRDVTDQNLTRAELERRAAVLQVEAALLDLVPESIIVRDMSGRITFWNRGAEELLGYDAAEAVGSDYRELLETAFPRPYEEIKAELLRDGRWEGVVTHTDHEGHPVAVHATWVLQFDDDGRPQAVLGMGRRA